MAASRTRLLKGIGVGAAVFLLLGTVTGLVPNPLYVRMVPRRPADYLFLTATAAFAVAFVVQRGSTGDATSDRFATGGGVVGLLAFGCPVCNVLLVSLFGSSALMTYFEPLRPVLGVVAVALFGAVLYYQRQRTCATC
ncbi:hypothetical protein [Halobacterium wangiae]|uniref:hypothetical protein n=1 Tax=Halobacterium wangiae TaxID=2902623 RepID=UPI001E4EBBE1|nr:hypothetical protein [Halobacterium wangiae]